ncbi:hypothetical protein CBER1_05921 [Cercospora berteroae]|uniref:Uncharacterized protein n=1 Tax=Cercospora berteroae TaxID=357750 RepID=A0A2S6BS87_9PEZI|nr:hypothetical protein CBER1_05921 [Cercospora berteroae]
MIDYSRPVPALPRYDAEWNWGKTKETQLSKCIAQRHRGKQEPHDNPKRSDQQAHPESKAVSPELGAHDTFRYCRDKSFYPKCKNLGHEEAEYADFEMKG